MKNTIISIVIVAIIVIGGYFGLKSLSKNEVSPNLSEPNINTSTSPAPVVTAGTSTPSIPTTETTVIGKSVSGNDILAYHYGTGSTELLFVGGIHGGYEWNTVLTAYGLIDYLKANPSIIPQNQRVTIIPVLNPDGLNKVVGTTGRFTASNVSKSNDTVVAGRFNANEVDLNRNFDCDWQATGKWQNKTVSGGSSAFSEPESLAMKNYVNANKPAAVVVWYSAAGGVYSSSCHNDILPETATITKLYAKASGYPAYEDFDFYATTGDMVNWLAKSNIPAISVLLTNHTDPEWTKNKAGVDALFKYFTR